MDDEEEDDITFEEVMEEAARLEAGASYAALTPGEEDLLALLPSKGRQLALLKNASEATLVEYSSSGRSNELDAVMWRLAQAKDARDIDPSQDEEFWALVREEISSGRAKQADVCRATGFSREYIRLRMLGRKGGRGS